MKHIGILFITTAFFLSCESNLPSSRTYMGESASYEMAADEIDAGNAETNAADPLQQAAPVQKKIIKDGRMGLRVDELEATKQRIDSLLMKHKGYYAQETLLHEAYESTFSLKIRVPNENYELLIAAIESGKGEIRYKEINTLDVTEQFVDIETRLNNKRSYLLRYQELLKQAKSIKEILEVEEYIRSLVEEIESAEGRLRYLSNQVAYSTLDLAISKENDYKFTPGRKENFVERLKEALSTGWDGFVDFIIFLLSAWPLWLILTGVIYLFVKWRQRKKRRTE